MALPVFEHRDVVRALEHKLGVTLERTREWKGWFIVDGRKITKFSFPDAHGQKTLGHFAARDLRKKSLVSDEEFVALIDCSLSREGYVERLRDSGHLG